MTNFQKNKWQIQIHVSLKKSIQILFHDIDKKKKKIYIYIYIQQKKRINHLINSENKHIYCTLLISYYLYIYIYISMS